LPGYTQPQNCWPVTSCSKWTVNTHPGVSSVTKNKHPCRWQCLKITKFFWNTTSKMSPPPFCRRTSYSTAHFILCPAPNWSPKQQNKICRFQRSNCLFQTWFGTTNVKMAYINMHMYNRNHNHNST
jgi:hypothetical protein